MRKLIKLIDQYCSTPLLNSLSTCRHEIQEKDIDLFSLQIFLFSLQSFLNIFLTFIFPTNQTIQKIYFKNLSNSLSQTVNQIQHER